MKYYVTSNNMKPSSYQFERKRAYGNTRDVFLEDARRDLGTSSLPMLPKLSVPTYPVSDNSPYPVQRPLRPRAYYTKKPRSLPSYRNYNQRVVSLDEDDELMKTNTKEEERCYKRSRTQDYRYDYTTKAISPTPSHQKFQTEPLNSILPPDLLQGPVRSFEMEDDSSSVDDDWKSKSISDWGEDAKIMW